MGLRVKINGNWVEPKKVYGKVNGQWREGKLYAKSSGSWSYQHIKKHLTQPESGDGYPNNPWIFHMHLGDSIDWRPTVAIGSSGNLIMSSARCSSDPMSGAPYYQPSFPANVSYNNSTHGMSGEIGYDKHGKRSPLGTYVGIGTFQYGQITREFHIIVEE